MNIALVGYGNMGKEIEQVLSGQKSHQICSISYKNRTDSLDIAGIKQADVVIDFTSPEVVLENIRAVAKLGKHMVIGTTGWLDHLAEVEKLVRKQGIGLIYGSNFSIGANIFFQLTDFATQLVEKFGQGAYDVVGFDMHHRGKKDSPSGTGKTLADIIMKHSSKKSSVNFDRVNRKIRDDELHFVSIRGGHNPGRHEIVFDSLADEIRLVHQARGRRGFAEGAVAASEFVINKKGVYRFESLFEEGVRI